MKNLYTTLLFLMSVLLIQPAVAQKKVVDLNEAIIIALENSSEIKTQKYEIQKANAFVKEAYGYAMPTVNFSAGYTRFIEKPMVPFIDFEAMLNNATYGVLMNEGLVSDELGKSKMLPMNTTLMSMAQSNNYEAKLEASQILFNAAVIQGIGNAAIYKESSEFGLEAKAAKVVTDVTKAFYGVLLTKEMLDITQSTYENIERNFKSVEAMYKEGFVAEYDRLTVEVQLENFKATVTAVKTGLVSAMNGLKIVMGLSPTDEIDIEGKLEYIKNESLNYKTIVANAYENNYDLQSLDYKKQIDNAFLDLEKAGYYPTLVAFGSFSRNGSSDNSDFMSYNQALIGASVSINLFQGLRTDRKVEQQKVEILKTQETVETVKKVISMQILNTLQKIDLIQNNIESAERTVKLAEKAYTIANVKYKEGKGTQLDVINAEHQLRASKTNILQYYYDYISAVEDLKYISGNVDKQYLRGYEFIKEIK